MNSVAFFGAIELGLTFAIVALAVFLSFRVLNFPDLTVDSSFTLGAGLAATLIVAGVEPFLATLAAALAGACAGLVTAWLHVRFRILNLLASILTMMALYSVNLRVMGAPNVALLTQHTVMTPFEALGMPETAAQLGVAALLLAIVFIGLRMFLGSERGLALRATGSNPRMSVAQSIDTGRMIYLGIALSNAIVAVAGALFAQMNGFADISIGTGTLLVGLASVVIGEAIVGRRSMSLWLAGCVLGAVLYRLTVAFALSARWLGLNASDLNIVTAVVVAAALVLPSLRRNAARKGQP